MNDWMHCATCGGVMRTHGVCGICWRAEAKREAERVAQIETVPLGPKLRVFVCSVHGIGYAFGCSVTAKSMPGALKALRRKLKAEKRQGVEQITIKLTDLEPQP